MEGHIDYQVLLSVGSFLFTVYFWVVKARRERPNLEFHQLANYRTSCRRHPDLIDKKRLSFQQLDTGGVLIVNHSTRQNSVVLFECFLETKDGFLRGDWGYTGDDKPPWNVGPESTIAFSPACFFDVPSDYEVPENPTFYMRFATPGGRQYSHRFTKNAPRLALESDEFREAA